MPPVAQDLGTELALGLRGAVKLLRPVAPLPRGMAPARLHKARECITYLHDSQRTAEGCVHEGPLCFSPRSAERSG